VWRNKREARARRNSVGRRLGNDKFIADKYRRSRLSYRTILSRFIAIKYANISHHTNLPVFQYYRKFLVRTIMASIQSEDQDNIIQILRLGRVDRVSLPGSSLPHRRGSPRLPLPPPPITSDADAPTQGKHEPTRGKHEPTRDRVEVVSPPTLDAAIDRRRATRHKRSSTRSSIDCDDGFTRPT
jgi:hypothetical protein